MALKPNMDGNIVIASHIPVNKSQTFISILDWCRKELDFIYMLGAFTEELVEKTIRGYLNENIAYFRKSYVPVSIINKYTKNDGCVQLRGKADVDYYGVYEGKYISFEVKETEKDVFRISQIAPHQLDILSMVRNCLGQSFLLLNFVSYDDSCFLIHTDSLESWIAMGNKSISIENAKKIGHHLPITFPGVIDFLSFFREG